MLCKGCGLEKSESDFYVSNLSRCKDCVKAKARAHRADNLDYYRQYDKQRAPLPHRVEAREAYRKTEAYVRSHNAATARYALTNTKRRAAHIAVGNAVRDGILVPMPCQVCGNKAQAHHPDYDRPLDVVWLCAKHHKEAHALVDELEKEAA